MWVAVRLRGLGVAVWLRARLKLRVWVAERLRGLAVAMWLRARLRGLEA